MNKKLLMLALLLCSAGAIFAQPKIISHRGYWKTDGSAQNSLTSMRKAAELPNVFGSEFDVWYTIDKQLVVNHDRKFHGVDMRTAPSSEILAIELVNGETIPTLDSYLQQFTKYPDVRVILEMKSLGKDKAGLKREVQGAKTIAKKLKEYGLLERTDIIAFSLNACKAFVKILPNNKVYYLNGDIAPAELKKMGMAGFDYDVKVMYKHPEWVKEAHDLGMEVNVWTVNTPEDARYIAGLGVDYMTTDHPTEILDWIK